MSGGGVDKLLPGGVLWAPVVRDMHCMSPPLIGLLYISDPSLLQWIMILELILVYLIVSCVSSVIAIY